MNPYTFRVSIRITHPVIDPLVFTKQIGLAPKRQWSAGEPRTNPNGNVLGGVWPNSFWCADLTGKEALASEDQCIEDFLDESVDRLKEHSALFGEITSSGGRVEFFIGLFGTKNFGLTLNADLLHKLAASQIELALDVYP